MKLFDTYLYKVNNHYNANRDVYVHTPVYSFDGQEPQKQSADSLYRNEIETKPNGVKYKYEDGPLDRFDINTKTPIVDTLYKKSYVFDNNTFGLIEEFVSQKPDVRQNGYMKEVSSGKSIQLDQHLFVPYLIGCYTREFIEINKTKYVSNYVDDIEIPNLDSINDELIIISNCNLRKGQLPIRYDIQIPRPKADYGREVITFVTTDGIEGEVPYRVVDGNSTINPPINYLIDNNIKHIINDKIRPTIVDKFNLSISDIDLTVSTGNNFYSGYRFNRNYKHKNNTTISSEQLSYHNAIIKESVTDILSVKTDNILSYSKELFFDTYRNPINSKSTETISYNTQPYKGFDSLYNDVRASEIEKVYKPEYKLNEYDYRDVTHSVTQTPDYTTSIFSKLNHNPTAKYVFSDEIKIYDNFRSILEATTHNQSLRTDTYEQNKVPYVFDKLSGTNYDLYVRELPTYIEKPYRFTFNRLVDYKHYSNIESISNILYSNKPYRFDNITEVFSELDLSSKDYQLSYNHSKLSSIENTNSYTYFVSDSPEYLYNPYVFAEHKLFDVSGSNNVVDRTIYKAPNKPYKEFEPRLSDFNGEKTRYEQYTPYFKFNHKGSLYIDNGYVLPKVGEYLREEKYTGLLYNDNGYVLPKVGEYLREEKYTGNLYRGTDLVLYTHRLDKYSKDLIKSTETLRYNNPLDDKAVRELPLGTYELRYENPLDDKSVRELPLGTYELRYDSPLDDKAVRELPLGTETLSYPKVSKIHPPLEINYTIEHIYNNYLTSYDITPEIKLDSVYKHINLTSNRSDLDPSYKLRTNSTYETGRYIFDTELKYQSHITRLHEPKRNYFPDLNIDKSLPKRDTSSYVAGKYLGPVYKHTNTLLGSDVYTNNNLYKSVYIDYAPVEVDLTTLRYNKKAPTVSENLPERTAALYVSTAYLDLAYKHSLELDTSTQFRVDNLYKNIYKHPLNDILGIDEFRYNPESKKYYLKDIVSRTSLPVELDVYLKQPAVYFPQYMQGSTEYRAYNLYKNVDLDSTVSSIADLSVLRYSKGLTLVNKDLFDRHSEPYFISNYLKSAYKHSTFLPAEKKVFNQAYKNLPVELTQYAVKSEFRYPSPVIVNKSLPELHSSEYTVNNYLAQTDKHPLSIVSDKKLYNTPYQNITLSSGLDFSSDVYVRYSNKEIIVNKELPLLFSGEYSVDNYLAQISKHPLSVESKEKILPTPYKNITFETGLDVTQLGTFRYQPSSRIINDSLPQLSTNVYEVNNYLKQTSKHPLSVSDDKRVYNTPYKKITVESGLELYTGTFRYQPSSRIINDSLPQLSTNVYEVNNYLSRVSEHPIVLSGEQKIFNTPYRKITVDSGLQLTSDKTLRYQPSKRIINDSLPQLHSTEYTVDNYLAQAIKHPLSVNVDKKIFNKPYLKVDISAVDLSQLGTFRYQPSKRIINNSLPQLHSTEYTVNNYLKQTINHPLSVNVDKKIFNKPYLKVETELDLSFVTEFRYQPSTKIVNKGLPRLHSKEYTVDNYLASAFKHPANISIEKPSSYTRLYKNITVETELVSNIGEFRYGKGLTLVNKDLFERHSEPYFISNYLASAYKHDMSVSVEADKEFFKPYRKIDSLSLVSYDLGEFRYSARKIPVEQSLFTHTSSIYTPNNYLKQPIGFDLPYTGSEFRYTNNYSKIRTSTELEKYTGEFRYKKLFPPVGQELFDRASQEYISNSYLKQIFTHFPLSQKGYQETLYTDIYNKINRHETPNLSVGEINYKNYTKSFELYDNYGIELDTEYVVNYTNYTKTLDVNSALFNRHSDSPNYNRYLKRISEHPYTVALSEPTLKSKYGIAFVYETSSTDVEFTIDISKVYNNYLNVAKRNIGTVSNVDLDTPLYNNKTLLRNDLNKTEVFDSNVADKLLPEFRYTDKHNKLYTGAFRNRPDDIVEHNNDTYLSSEKDNLFHSYNTLDLVVKDRIQLSPYTFEFKKHNISVPQLVTDKINVPRYLTDVLSDNISTSYGIDRQIHSKNYFRENLNVNIDVLSDNVLSYVTPTYRDVNPQFKSLNLISIDKHIQVPSYFHDSVTPELTTSYRIDREIQSKAYFNNIVSPKIATSYSIDKHIHINNYLGENYKLQLTSKDTTVLKYVTPLYKDISVQSQTHEYTPRIESPLYSHNRFDNLTRYNIDTYGRTSEFKMARPSWSRTDVKQPYNDFLLKDQYRETFRTYHSLESVDFRQKLEQDHQVVIYDKPWYLVKPEHKSYYSDVFNTPGVYNLDGYNKRYTDTNEYDNLNIAESGIRYESNTSKYFLGLTEQEEVFKPFRYKNDLNKFSKSGFNLGTKQKGYEKEVYLVKARALFLSDIYVDENILAKFRYDNYSFGTKTRDEIKLDYKRGQNYLTRLDVDTYIDEYSTRVVYNNNLEKYSSLDIDSGTLSTPRYDNYLNDLSVPFTSISFVSPRYDNNLEKYSTNINGLTLSTPRYDNYLIKPEVADIEISTSGIRYNNTLEKYSRNINGLTLSTPRYNNYLNDLSVTLDTISTSGIRYNNTLEKYSTNINGLTLSIPRYNNYLIKPEVADIEISTSGIRYNNNLEKYSTNINGLTLSTPRYDNYLNDLSVPLDTISTSEIRYNNNLEKYSTNINGLTLSAPRYNNYLNDLSVPLDTVSVSGIRYNNTLEKYVSLDIDTKVVSDRIYNYLPTLNEFYVPETPVYEFRYDSKRIENSLAQLDIKVTAEFTHRYLPNVEYEIAETIKEFKYVSDLSKYNAHGYSVNTTHKQTFNYNNNLEKYAVEPIINVATSDDIRYNNTLDKYIVNDTSYKTTSNSGFKYNNNISSYVPEVEITEQSSEEVSTFRYNNSVAKYNSRDISTQVTLNSKIYTPQLEKYLDKTPDTRYLLEKKIYETDVFKIRDIEHYNIDEIISTSTFNSSYNKPSISSAEFHRYDIVTHSESIKYNNRIQTTKKKDFRVYILQDEHRFTDIEFRFEQRGPINHNPYGKEVKVYYAENTRQEVAWERDLYEQPELTKSRETDYGFYPHYRQNNPRETIVEKDVPAATLQNQIDYHFGNKGLLKYEQLEATYEIDGRTYPTAAPKNMSVKGPMRYATRATLRNIIETDPNKIDWTTTAPVYPQNGDRTSLFSDRFFLQ